MTAADYSILDHLMEGCQVIDFEFRYRYVNDTLLQHGRRSREELMGSTMMEVYPGIEKTALFASLKKCLQERVSAKLDNEFRYQDGSSAWFALKMEPIPEGLFILSIDITDRKQIEHDLQAQLSKLEALREIDQAVITQTELDHILETILTQITQKMDLDAADILLPSPQGTALEYAAGLGFRTPGILKTRLPLGNGHAGRAAAARRTIFVPDLLDPREPYIPRSFAQSEGFVSYCAEPLVAKGRLVGVLEIFSRRTLVPNRSWFDFLGAVGDQASIAIENGRLFHDLQHSNQELTLAYDRTIAGWSKALDLRHKETVGHTMRVAEMTLALARKAGIPDNQLVHIKRGALLHDIGKMGIPDSILLKQGQLSAEEWKVMKKHPQYALEWLYPIKYLRPALAIPYYHHEKWDGTGYPQGLKGELIPLAARLFAVIDVWDALSSDRPYRDAWPRERVLSYLQEQSGAHFDPQAVKLFLELAQSGQDPREV